MTVSSGVGRGAGRRAGPRANQGHASQRPTPHPGLVSPAQHWPQDQAPLSTSLLSVFPLSTENKVPSPYTTHPFYSTRKPPKMVRTGHGPKFLHTEASIERRTQRDMEALACAEAYATDASWHTHRHTCPAGSPVGLAPLDTNAQICLKPSLGGSPQQKGGLSSSPYLSSLKATALSGL